LFATTSVDAVLSTDIRLVASVESTPVLQAPLDTQILFSVALATATVLTVHRGPRDYPLRSQDFIHEVEPVARVRTEANLVFTVVPRSGIVVTTTEEAAAETEQAQSVTVHELILADVAHEDVRALLVQATQNLEYLRQESAVTYCQTKSEIHITREENLVSHV
jgi:hypothetical protein